MRTKETIFYSSIQPCAPFDLEMLSEVKPGRGGLAPFDIELAGITHCGEKFLINFNSCRVCAFILTIGGRGYCRCSQKLETLTDGDLLILRPGMEACYHTDKSHLWQLAWFNFLGALPEALLNSYGLNGHWYLPGVHLEEEFRQGLKLLKNERENTLLKMSHYLLSLVQRISEKRNSLSLNPESRAALAIRKYIDTCFNRRITVHDLADLVGRSKSQVIRIFQKNFGMTPYQYLLERRLRTAENYLLSSQKNIKEIAYEMGFHDEFHFSAMFRKRNGLSPSAFRQAGRGLSKPENH